MSAVQNTFRLARAQSGLPTEAFHTYATEDAILLPMGEQPTRGRDAIHALMAAGTARAMTWTPVAADVARSGELGFTWGTYEIRGNDASGNAVVRHGKYLTVWKRQGDGAWKHLLDIGNSSPAPP